MINFIKKWQERGEIQIKGKGKQVTYWLLGEDVQAHEARTKERTERRGSRALLKAHLQQGMKNINVGPKSSLKNRDNAIPRTSLTRSSSLESPKKLRFATGSQLENYRYHRYLLFIKNFKSKIIIKTDIQRFESKRLYWVIAKQQ